MCSPTLRCRPITRTSTGPIRAAGSDPCYRRSVAALEVMSMDWFRTAILLLAAVLALRGQNVSSSTGGIPKFQIRSGQLELRRPTHPGAFFDVAGRRAMVVGYENREAEAWVYPLEI